MGLVRADVDPDSLARALVATADGLTVQWLMDPTFDLVEHVRAHFELLMRSIVTDGGGLTAPDERQLIGPGSLASRLWYTR